MNEVETTIDINAPADVVWTVLTDFERYAEWNPFITDARGRVVEGEDIEIRLDTPGGRSVRLEPTVLAVTENELLQWRGQYLAPRLFDGTHTVELEALDESRTRVVQREEFTGTATDQVFGATSFRDGLDAMNRALKERTESIVVL
ncbi:SRPBCC family protein [Haloarchaeobius sp. DT45]|uniref:SRPBCC family protein n=1 Tax=Haloarchaeobius sp. DT45 TaxID=3446116 RepID=UPI003F6B8695